MKTERTLTLLRALCIHNGTPVVPNQESIRVRLFLSTPEALLVKLRIDTRAGLAAAPVAASDESVLAQSGLVEEKEVMILPTPDYFQEGSAPRWIPIREFIAESSEDYFG